MTRTFTLTVLGMLLLATGLGLTAAGEPAEGSAPPTPAAPVLAETLQAIGESTRELGALLPVVRPRLEAIRTLLVEFREAVAAEDDALELARMKLIELTLLLHILVRDLERGIQARLGFQEWLREEVGRITEGLPPRESQRIATFARELVQRIEALSEDESPRLAHPGRVAPVLERLKDALFRLDVYLLRSIRGAQTTD